MPSKVWQGCVLILLGQYNETKIKTFSYRLYPKVLYKLTTDPDELHILTTALTDSGLLG